MFFIFGISTDEKKLDYIQTLLCSNCSQYGKLELYMTYYYFSLFFIPLIKWNKKFVVKSSCCGSIFAVDSELGKRIYKGETVILTGSDLTIVNNNHQHSILCKHCNQPLQSDFTYCPNCGKPMK